MAACNCGEVEPQKNFRFSPPLFIQRYRRVAELIRKHGKGTYSKIVDIGCSSMGLFPYLKSIRGVKEIFFMDIDYPTLKTHCCRVNPFPAEFLQKRKAPLAVSVMCADARYLHAPLRNADVVIMVEFIEHLEEADLANVVRAVFSGVTPRLIIITTPNRDFNKNFPDLPEGKFRHADHKFEFSHPEFVSWCKCAISNFPYYDVNFSGCGGPVDGIFGTQTAVFTRKKIYPEVLEAEFPSPSPDRRYDALQPEFRPCHTHCRTKWSCSVVHEVQYPHDTRTPDERQRDVVMESWGSFRSCLGSCLHRLLDLTLGDLQDAADWSPETGTPLKETADGEGAAKAKQGFPIFISRSSMVSKTVSPDNDGDAEEEDGKIFVKFINDVHSLKEIRLRESNVLFLFDSEESFYVPRRTFLSWARLKVEKSKIEDAFNAMKVERLEAKHETLFVVRFAKVDSEEEPDHHSDSSD